MSSSSLTVAFVPGVTPGKWISRWRDLHPEVDLLSFQCDAGEQVEVLRSGRAELSFVRFPVDREGLHVIPLYTEVPVVCAPQDHDVELYDEVPFEELKDQNILDPAEMGGEKMALEVVASGAGLLILPMSVARLYSRKDVVVRPLTGVPETQIGVAWFQDNDSELVEEFIGIVRGRGAKSSRQPSVLTEQQLEAARALKKRQSAKSAAKSAKAQPKTPQKQVRSKGANAARKPAKGRLNKGRGSR